MTDFNFFLWGEKKKGEGGVMSEDVFNVCCNCVCVGCGFVCFLSISFSLFPLLRDRNSNQLCSIGDVWGDWMMMGGSGNIRSGGSVEELRETFRQGHSSSGLPRFICCLILVDLILSDLILSK